MHLIAKVKTTSASGTQIRIMKRNGRQTHLVSRSEARELLNDGRITKTNFVFDKYAENDFDLKKTLDYFRSRK